MFLIKQLRESYKLSNSIDEIVINDISHHLSPLKGLQIKIDLKVEGPGTYPLFDGRTYTDFTPFSCFCSEEVELKEGESLVRAMVSYGKNSLAVFEYDLHKVDSEWKIYSLSVVLGKKEE